MTIWMYVYLSQERYGTWRTESDGFYVRWQRVRDPVHDRVCLPVCAGHPSDRVCLPVDVCLPVHTGRPCGSDRLPAEHGSSATFPFFLTTRYRSRVRMQQWMRGALSYRDGIHAGSPGKVDQGKIDPSSASRHITTLVHAHIPGPVDTWREFPVFVRDQLFDMFTWRFTFTRPEDLPRARAVWESTAQTNLRKSMWEARDKAQKSTGNRDPRAWLDDGPSWLRTDYWQSLCERWAAGPWQQRSQAAIRNKSTHPEKNVHTSGSISYATHSKKLHHELERAHTFRELFDRTHKRKGTDDYVSESARTIVERYDRTMTERYAEGTPLPDLDAEAWVEAAEEPRKGRVYGFGDSLDTQPVLSSYASSIASPAHVSSSSAPPISGVQDIRGIIREELRTELQTQREELQMQQEELQAQRVEIETQRAQLQTQFSDMLQQFLSIMQGVRPTQPAAQDPAPDDDEAGTADDPADLC
ncbi:hypothetical protein Taro_025515 [Colocasia esculenta]|uniref:Uncharacterized protein n=1 Tax=Colocasia esculenta TaxID=4460 RepID=A0A843VCH2_COLES|nr:hypothetical protein [Colocasia esculenta]